MTGRNPGRCQNCGYSTRYSRQLPNEQPEYCVNHQAWLCAGCRELRGCADAKHRIESTPVRTDFQKSIPPNDGIYQIPDTVYHSDLESLSSSGARALLSMTPEEFDYQRREPSKPKKHFDFGHAAHKMVLGEGAELAVLDPKKHGLTKDGKVSSKPASTSMWQETEAKFREQGKTVITKAQMDEAQRMAGQVFAHRAAARILTAADGMAERSIYWHDDDTGVRRRIRPDYLVTEGFSRPICIDYKSAKSASRKAFEHSVREYGYHMQQAYYEDGLAELGLEGVGFLFVVQSKDPPYTVAVYPLDPEIVELGRRQNRQAIELFKRCTDTGVWPGYDGIQDPIGMGSWAVKQIEESLSNAA